jgi:hypothetical protein
MNSAGTEWLYVTYLGGQRDDWAYSSAADSAGNAIVTGTTNSDNFPRAAALQPALACNADLVLSTNSSGTAWRGSDTGIQADSVSQIAEDPASAAHLFAADSPAFNQSFDGGAAWTALPGVSSQGFQSVSFGPSGSGVVYARGQFDSYSYPVYSSRDSGATATLAGYSPCPLANIQVDPAPATTLYAASGYAFGCQAEQSTNDGAAWISVGAFPLAATSKISRSVLNRPR